MFLSALNSFTPFIYNELVYIYQIKLKTFDEKKASFSCQTN